MVLSYDGSAYNGWQKQGNTGNTIQEKLERILSAILKQSVAVIGSGRTDMGVHALGQTANFHAETDMDTAALCVQMRAQLPKDICLHSLSEVDARFHARLNAVGKTYCYHIRISEPNVFKRQYEWFIPGDLDISKMQNAAQCFVGTHDYRAFSSYSGNKSTVRRIDSIEVKQNGTEITLRFSGNGFLYHMVRKITGTLVEIGKGQTEETVISEMLSSCNTVKNLAMAPAKGLFLEEVRYG